MYSFSTLNTCWFDLACRSSDEVFVDKMQNQSIARVQIDAGGHGYVDGQFNITSPEGSDFTSSFAVDAEGAVVQVMIQSHGREFTTDPSEYDMYYSGTSIKQVCACRWMYSDSGLTYPEGLSFLTRMLHLRRPTLSHNWIL